MSDCREFLAGVGSRSGARSDGKPTVTATSRLQTDDATVTAMILDSLERSSISGHEYVVFTTYFGRHRLTRYELSTFAVQCDAESADFQYLPKRTVETWYTSRLFASRSPTRTK